MTPTIKHQVRAIRLRQWAAKGRTKRQRARRLRIVDAALR